MGFQSQYERGKPKLLADQSICPENRQLFAEFFAFQERKLKRRNGLAALDNGCYNTLYGYIIRLRNVNRWFENKPWRHLTRDDIQRVYDGLEDRTILNQKGTAVRNAPAYYNKIFKSKPFELAGKADLARDVVNVSRKEPRVVRFVTEEMFRKVVGVVTNPRHALLLWLAWDIGENINTLLQLAKRDCTPGANKHTGDREYVIWLAPEKLKRSRQSRSEPTLYADTVRWADAVLAPLAPDERVFPFSYEFASKLLRRACQRSGATSMPNAERIRWKDLRSGMACHLLKNGFTRDEVNARLGHTPSSDVLNAYINFLALDRDQSKQRLVRARTEQLEVALVEAKQRAQLMGDRLQHQSRDFELLRAEVAHSRLAIEELRRQLGEAVGLVQSAAVKLRQAG